MRKQWFVITMTIVLILCTAALVQASDNSLGIANKQTIVFSSPTLVGGTLLPAGEYQVLHQMNGTEHIMVFKGVAGTKGEAKAKCTLVPLGEKASQDRTALHRKRQERACPAGNDVPGRLVKARARAVT